MQEHTPQLPLFTTAPHDPTLEIPYGFCRCGCGQKTKIAKETNKSRGLIQGEPYHFVRGHHGRRPVQERFWEKVDRRGPDECWLWTGNTVDGYGTLRIPGTTIKAHRFSYEIHIGPIPDNLYVLHRCDVRNCVNPNHFFLGTHAENMKDMIAKGRQGAPRGEHHPNAHLTESQVHEIRRLRALGLRSCEIAAEIGITPSQVWGVVAGVTWKHINSPSLSERETG